jgi:lipopolysaccharide/colanic/teichoic acid biosynthesis glycosyltransferase
MKRFFDLFAATAGLLFLAPLLVLLAVLVRLDSPGPILYRARRAGRYGKPFALLKFRTMTHQTGRPGPAITLAGDQRVTRTGRLLRHYKLDELPQLFNVLKGEMSLVGPRPEDPRYVALYTPEQRQVLAVWPGITSPASLAYRDEAALLHGDDWEQVYTRQIMPHKLALELAYLQQQSFGRDLALIWQTILLLFS